MNIRKLVGVLCTSLILSSAPFPAAAEDLTNALHALLQQRVEVEKRDAAIVVGLVDEHGSRIVSCGKLDNGTARQVDGDTLFGIGSSTKTFTALLLQDMIERGEMKLDDPVARYLPKAVKMPTRNGKEITLLQLVLHTSGLPANPGNLDPKSGFADYTADQLYAFLSGYKLRYDPGARYHYSNLGASLLGHVIALKAGTNYESLVADRICRPLKMDSTRIAGGRSPVLYAQGGLGSTASDMLKYVSAHVGLTRTSLAPLIEKTRVVHVQPGILPQNLGSWFVVSDPQGRKFVLHDGDAGGYSAYVAFDETKRRGLVVLCFSGDADAVASLGACLLESEWEQDKRPKEIKISSAVYDSYVGQYRRAGVTGTASQPGIAIRREGNRIIAQTTGPRSWPMRALLPSIAGELLPGSETRLFGRMSGIPITFSRDARDKVVALNVQFGGETFSYEKISDQPLTLPEPPRPPVAIKLDTKLIDACVGHYEFATNGMKLTLQRQGDQLVSQAWVEDDTDGLVDVYPESKTKFFDKFGNQWTFIKNDKHEVTALILHGQNFPDWKGKKLSDLNN
ncbi:serine hydrolase [Pedosphaera parvula]|uniref:Beta-lactamase n=1 Tax=Pedosphaera parvula (strain Ellin514) TaxID=320771 RepID=B9XQA2_PEDPL|nr:serine hydrolase [Pedosphaera parvula]EEF57926.1 beta-lactamase [Pedosphaera parvula Ellin514]